MIARLEKIAGRAVSRETFCRLELFAALLREENQRQNLVARSTLDSLWERHILDSAQLVRFEPRERSSWVDIGSGAGLPGLVIALLVEGPVALIEPRRLRAEFLAKTSEALGLADRVSIHCDKAERVTGHFDVITARAVASLDRLLKVAGHLSTGKTVWALPKGRSAQSELVEARRAWQGAFHVEPSLTDAGSHIVVGTGVRAKHR
jgi:16S rRNA (guanine527-N7)-methyltransferase